MAEYIEREAFLTQKREQYCKDCARRKGMRNGKYKTLYEIGEAPCRACEIDDVLNDVEDFPAADVRPVVRGRWKLATYSGKYGNAKEKWYDQFFDGAFWYCDQCRERARKSNFCPNCGCQMDGEDDGT